MPSAEEPRPASPAIARYVWALPGMAAGVLLAVVMLGSPATPVVAQVPIDMPPIAGGAGLYVMPARLGWDVRGREVYGAYLLDVDNQRLLAYQVAPDAPVDEPSMRLLAVRETTWDRGLRDFNSGAPTPEEMRRLIQKQEDAARVREGRIRQ